MGMIVARSLRGLSIAQGAALLCLKIVVRVSQNRGAPRFYSTTLHIEILERTLCLIHVIIADWSRTSAEIHRSKPRGLLNFGNAGDLLTHPTIYGSSDPQARELFRHILAEEFYPSWYWARTRDKASHGPIPIPLGYHGLQTLRREDKIKVFDDLCGNSLELNPIENLWHILKNPLAKMNCTTTEQIINSVIQVWFGSDEIKNMCATLKESIPRHVEKVISTTKGGHTSY
ncbi:hypothetical protein TNCV_840171 [Trichonephila clavipes]|nr:hypothetical protein TNCV_840171 [Trichonephila clavipes]